MKEQQTFLLVDDSEDNLFLLRAAFKKANCDNPLQEAHDGEDAISYLKGEGSYADRGLFPLPTVMLLDLNMPKKNGFDVLEWVRAQPGLKRLPIFVLTSSMRLEDVDLAFDLGANAFLVKPISLDTLSEMMRCLSDWVQINEVPHLVEVITN